MFNAHSEAKKITRQQNSGFIPNFISTERQNLPRTSGLNAILFRLKDANLRNYHSLSRSQPPISALSHIIGRFDPAVDAKLFRWQSLRIGNKSLAFATMRIVFGNIHQTKLYRNMREIFNSANIAASKQASPRVLRYSSGM